MRSRLLSLIALFVAGCGAIALAQEKGTLEPRSLPPLANPSDPATPAKELFGRESGPAPLAARTIGFYSRGCLAGGRPLPVNGPAWQVMRLSRNRNWGHPALIAFLEQFAAQGADRQPLAGHSRRRHVAAARRADADGARLASDRP